MVPFVLAINNSSLWGVFLWVLLSWAVLIGVYSLNVFDFLGEEWKQKLIEKRFRKK